MIKLVKNNKTSAGRRANRRKDKRKKRKEQKQQRLQAEARAELKRQAEEEAEKQAEEARRKAEQQVKEEAKRQAAIEAQKQAEIELQAKEEARKKAEEEAKKRSKLPTPPAPLDDKIFDRLRENLPPVNNLLDFADLCNAERRGIAISIEQFEEDLRPFGIKVRFNRGLYAKPASISEWQNLERELKVRSRYLLTVSSSLTLFDLGILNIEIANMSHEYEGSYVVLAIDWLVHDYFVTPTDTFAIDPAPTGASATSIAPTSTSAISTAPTP